MHDNRPRQRLVPAATLLMGNPSQHPERSVPCVSDCTSNSRFRTFKPNLGAVPSEWVDWLCTPPHHDVTRLCTGITRLYHREQPAREVEAMRILVINPNASVEM